MSKGELILNVVGGIGIVLAVFGIVLLLFKILAM